MPFFHRLKDITRRLPGYLVFLARSRYSKNLGWYSKLPDRSLVTRREFLHGYTMNCYIRPENLRIPLEAIDDLDTSADVFENRHYERLEQCIQPGTVVWDIGANIGVASLIFARHASVTHVYAFEPMPHTFECAQRTLAANPDLAPKITIENLGIGGSDCDLEVSYTEKAKCAIGLSKIPPRLVARYGIQPKDMKLITIHIADADRILRSIQERHPGAPILLKLDAEGAEYGIMERLTQTGGLHAIAATSIEWHDDPGEPYIKSRLLNAGFHTAEKVLEPDNSIGIIDAWR